MELDARGHPLHTRVLSVTLRHDGPGHREAAASLLDVRKRGFLPSAGDLQGAGVVHHMQVDARVAESDRSLERVSVSQPTVAFEPSAATRGESCRDPAPYAEGLVGEQLDETFGRRLAVSIGGPRSCTHVLSALRLAGAAVPWALDREVELSGAAAAWRMGERTFRRDLVYDGAADGDRGWLSVQLQDLHFSPASEGARPMERFAEQREVRLLAEIDFVSMKVVSLGGAQRRRGPEDFDTAQWVDLDDALAGLDGFKLLPGAGREILRRMEERGDAPLREMLLHMTPAWLQCLATFDENYPFEGERKATWIGLGSTPDACWMWRAGGVLDRAR